MLRILLIKTSSLGDIVHNFPVVSDIRQHFDDAEIDWVVEESFSDLPRLHPAVARIIPVAFRRWRKALLNPATWREWVHSRNAIRSVDYDVVIDTQGLLKSALVATWANGRKVGLDWASSREPLRPFYNETHAIPRALHAIERNRMLAAGALHYTLEGPPRFGARADAGSLGDEPWFEALAGTRYGVFMHATSAESKLWPEHQWAKLGSHVSSQGVRVVLPWSSEAECARSERLSDLIPHSIVPPRLPLAKVAALLAGARLGVGVDTGLTHLSVAMGTPTVGIYCATAPERTGVYGSPTAVNVGRRKHVPAMSEVVSAIHKLAVL